MTNKPVPLCKTCLGCARQESSNVEVYRCESYIQGVPNVQKWGNRGQVREVREQLRI
jgi:hypothetical protein